ncbi:MAG: hypothetical protein IPK97_03980 [Ahniella sp.]|nr:hypothetical protein [Ahniella sp.]
MLSKTVLCLMTLGLVGCSPASRLDCSGEGNAYGRFEDSNYGALEFKHAVVVTQLDGSATVLFTDDATLAAVMRNSQYPLSEGPDAAKTLGKHMVGFEYDSGGNYKQRIVVGNQGGSGWSGADRGSISVDKEGCARGHAYLDGDDSGVFAVPVWRDPSDLAVEPGGVPVSAPLPAAPDAAVPSEQDPLELWRLAWTRLHQSDPAQALQALGMSPGAAASMIDDKRALATLERMRTQCADAASAVFDPEYQEVVGPTPQHEGMVFTATVRARPDGDSAVIDNCYVMFRNEVSIEQCWPLQQDCRTTKAWEG